MGMWTNLCHECIYVDDAPTMQDLPKIRDRIGSSYDDLGRCLLNDDTGQVIEGIKDDYSGSKVRLDEIFRRWIKGEGKKWSWKGLIKCLKFAKLNSLAEDLELACSRENKHTDQQTETFPSIPSSTPVPHFKEKEQVNEQVNEQLKQENDTESWIYVIFSMITGLIVFTVFYLFKSDTTSGM